MALVWIGFVDPIHCRSVNAVWLVKRILFTVHLESIQTVNTGQSARFHSLISTICSFAYLFDASVSLSPSVYVCVWVCVCVCVCVCVWRDNSWEPIGDEVTFPGFLLADTGPLGHEAIRKSRNNNSSDGAEIDNAPYSIDSYYFVELTSTWAGRPEFSISCSCKTFA